MCLFSACFLFQFLIGRPRGRKGLHLESSVLLTTESPAPKTVTRNIKDGQSMSIGQRDGGMDPESLNILEGEKQLASSPQSPCFRKQGTHPSKLIAGLGLRAMGSLRPGPLVWGQLGSGTLLRTCPHRRQGKGAI